MYMSELDGLAVCYIRVSARYALIMTRSICRHSALTALGNTSKMPAYNPSTHRR